MLGGFAVDGTVWNAGSARRMTDALLDTLIQSSMHINEIIVTCKIYRRDWRYTRQASNHVKSDVKGDDKFRLEIKRRNKMENQQQDSWTAQNIERHTCRRLGTVAARVNTSLCMVKHTGHIGSSASDVYVPTLKPHDIICNLLPPYVEK